MLDMSVEHSLDVGGSHFRCQTKRVYQELPNRNGGLGVARLVWMSASPLTSTLRAGNIRPL